MKISRKTAGKNAPRRVVPGLIAVLFLVLTGVQPVLAQEAPLPSRDVKLAVDSGSLVNHGTEAEIVWSTIVDVPGALWLRLHFGTIRLAHDSKSLESSVIRITSLEDMAVQHLDRTTCRQWQNSTAYFNGDRLLVELIAVPNETENRVVISAATAGVEGSDSYTSICGPTDDRLLSDSQRDCRVMPVGCTAFIIDDPHHQFLTAGHCGDSPGDLQVTEFNVPLSDGEGNPAHPGPEDQYAVDPDSRQFSDNGPGYDWTYFGCYPNTETGLTPFMAGGGEFYTLADEAPQVSGQIIRITGYGTVQPPVPMEWNQVQKSHTGPYWDLSGTVIQYRVDTSGGNSGSAVFNVDSGEAIGIHTHGGCTSEGGANSGTAIDNSNLAGALENPQGVCAPFGLEISNLVGGETAQITATGATPGRRVFFGFSLSGEGEVPIDPLGVIIGISQPIELGSVIANASGEASLTRWIRPGATGHEVWAQAAEVGRTSIVVNEVVR